ncbi:hypothetical protein HYH02_012009 [Chlamydomonas schloesseri]|uniref:Uncharacterized protein n=1 Tax=Chlamydomonas schloesseri TaxID=2026947 RepID=A0A835W3Y1_9CHLO|nr:hypothetical protein HYH02_012009 [Chlamydomonas schloesseri]|eukprot:KAG2435011.1 hypothetical protein HYH02_012009 [Chlamydomonas schloesseri]
MGWAVTSCVPVEEQAWRMARAALTEARRSSSRGMRVELCAAILGLFNGFKVPVLVLLDELQALLQPTDARGELDLAGAGYIRDVLLRQILVASPSQVLWALTGSNMALVWMALADMPVSGVAPLHQIRQVALPSTAPAGLMDKLQEHNGPLWGLKDDDLKALREWSGGSPALFTMLDKMREELQKGWQRSFAHLTDGQRGGLLDMCFPEIGARMDEVKDKGLWRFLEPHLVETKSSGSGRYYLRDANQRQLLLTIIGRDGKLRTDWTGLLETGLTLVQLDWGWQLLRLGEVTIYLLRSETADMSGLIDGVTDFEKMLEGLADGAEVHLQGTGSVSSRWEAHGAFRKVLRSRHNDVARGWYERGGQHELWSHKDYLVFYLRLTRNVLAHQKPWDGPDLVDVDVVMGLAAIVGLSIADLSERVRLGMRELAPATIKSAAKAVAAIDAGGGDDCLPSRKAYRNPIINRAKGRSGGAGGGSGRQQRGGSADGHSGGTGGGRGRHSRNGSAEGRSAGAGSGGSQQGGGSAEGRSRDYGSGRGRHSRDGSAEGRSAGAGSGGKQQHGSDAEGRSGSTGAGAGGSQQRGGRAEGRGGDYGSGAGGNQQHGCSAKGGRGGAGVYTPAVFVVKNVSSSRLQTSACSSGGALATMGKGGGLPRLRPGAGRIALPVSTHVRGGRLFAKKAVWLA